MLTLHIGLVGVNADGPNFHEKPNGVSLTYWTKEKRAGEGRVFL